VTTGSDLPEPYASAPQAERVAAVYDVLQQETPAPEQSSELDVLDPVPSQLKLSNGAVVEFSDLKTRQFFRLMRIVTRGAGPLLMEAKLDPSEPGEVFVGKLVALVVFAIPEAEDEALEFIRSMVRPSGLIEDRRVAGPDKDRNDELTSRVDRALDNPELEDLVNLVEAIVRRAAPDVQSLGKRLQKMFQLAQRTGQVPSTVSTPITS
jgi:hypothetical protein